MNGHWHYSCIIPLQVSTMHMNDELLFGDCLMLFVCLAVAKCKGLCKANGVGAWPDYILNWKGCINARLRSARLGSAAKGTEIEALTCVWTRVWIQLCVIFLYNMASLLLLAWFDTFVACELNRMVEFEAEFKHAVEAVITGTVIQGFPCTGDLFLFLGLCFVWLSRTGMYMQVMSNWFTCR